MNGVQKPVEHRYDLSAGRISLVDECKHGDVDFMDGNLSDTRRTAF